MDNKLTILVAETSTAFGQTYTANLRSHGMIVIAVSSDGQDILDSINRAVPEVILMNACMTRINAIGVIQAINAMNLPKKPVVIVMSADSNGAISSQMMEAGASYFLTLPYDCTQLAERISQLAGCEDDRQIVACPSSIVYSSAQDIETLVSHIFHQLGVPANIQGYYFLREAIVMSIRDIHAMDLITKRIYPPLAKKYNTSLSSVERSIRHAIEVAWGRGNRVTLDSYFGTTCDNRQGKPTNSEFIATISDKLRLQLHISGADTLYYHGDGEHPHSQLQKPAH